MILKKIFIISVVLFFTACLGENKMKIKVIEQANDFGIALKNRKIETYLDNTAHFVYANDNEREELKTKIEEQLDYLQSRNNKIIRVESAMHSEIFENGGYYQCMVKQVSNIKNDFTIYGSNAYLLAISKDGEKWKFADVTNYNEKIVKKVFPELSSEIKFNNKDK